MTTLRQELQLQGGHSKIIRRRIVWLLGQWSHVRFSAELRPAMYSAMLALLQPHEDLVVRLTVSRALKKAMDDFDFSIDQFLEYLEPIVGLLFNLLKECKECDSKVRLNQKYYAILNMKSLHILLTLFDVVQFLNLLFRCMSCTSCPLLWNKWDIQSGPMSPISFSICL